MKIIAVNISHNIKEFEPLQATERAWKLNLERTKKYDFVIGVSKGEVYNSAYFKLLCSNIDEKHTDRVRFELIQCSPEEENQIRKFLSQLMPNSLKFITTKYF